MKDRASLARTSFMAHGRIDDDEIIASINVTPLVDVVLVLLVVLMVTATYVASRSIPIDPPSAHLTATAPAAALEVSIDRTGAVFVDATPVRIEALRVLATRYVSSLVPGRSRAIVSADRAAAHGDVVTVLDVLRDASIEHVSIRAREISR